jgi:hypothetical protein
MWAGPDGFGDTPEEEQRRIDMMVKLCRDDQFALLKLDSACRNLRPEKQDAFIRMMKMCREYQPDLIVLNHRPRQSGSLRHHFPLRGRRNLYRRPHAQRVAARQDGHP